MYKVFVNEKKLSLTKAKEVASRTIRYDSAASLEMAIDLLENTSTTDVNIYNDDIDKLWNDFNKHLHIIEAAGGIVKNKNNEILFIKRLGKWDLPKGKLEKGEALAEAAVREVAEETGLENMIIGEFLTTTYHIYTERNNQKVLKYIHWYAMSYKGNDVPTPQTEEGITEVQWLDQTKIKSIVLDNTFRNINMVLEDFGYLD